MNNPQATAAGYFFTDHVESLLLQLNHYLYLVINPDA